MWVIVNTFQLTASFLTLTPIPPLPPLLLTGALPEKNLLSTIEGLRSFQAVQRFKKGVNAGEWYFLKVLIYVRDWK